MYLDLLDLLLVLITFTHRTTRYILMANSTMNLEIDINSISLISLDNATWT